MDPNRMTEQEWELAYVEKFLHHFARIDRVDLMPAAREAAIEAWKKGEAAGCHQDPEIAADAEADKWIDEAENSTGDDS